MSLVSNLVGKRVYNASSAAPNRGQVSVQGANGYLQRELNNKAVTPAVAPAAHGAVSNWGPDGQSDTRSGVAAAALERTQSPQAPGAVKSFAGQSTAGFGTPSTPNTDVHITRTGALKLPFNFKYSAGILTQKKKAMDNLLKLRQARQAESLEYQDSLYDAGRSYDQTRMSTLSDNANRGTAFSSGYGKAVGDNATDYNTLIGKLASAEKLSQTNEIQQANQTNQGLNDYLQMAANEQGYTYDQEAGKWKLALKKKKKK